MMLLLTNLAPPIALIAISLLITRALCSRRAAAAAPSPTRTARRSRRPRTAASDGKTKRRGERGWEPVPSAPAQANSARSDRARSEMRALFGV